MYKVKINYSGNYPDIFFETEMPIIPTEKQTIGFWHNEYCWIIAKVKMIVFEFDEKNNYMLAEINVTDIFDN